MKYIVLSIAALSLALIFQNCSGIDPMPNLSASPNTGLTAPTPPGGGSGLQPSPSPTPMQNASPTPAAVTYNPKSCYTINGRYPHGTKGDKVFADIGNVFSLAAVFGPAYVCSDGYWFIDEKAGHDLFGWSVPPAFAICELKGEIARFVGFWHPLGILCEDPRARDVAFAVSPTFGIGPVVVSTSFIPDGLVASSQTTRYAFDIDWGDGTQAHGPQVIVPAGESSLQTFSHAYTRPGKYTIQITMRGPQPRTAVREVTIY